MKPQAVLIETDILVEYFLKKPSVLRELLKERVCYTTFVQMAEILACANTEAERELLMKPFMGLRVLGFHSRYSMSLAGFLKESEKFLQDFENDRRFRFCLVSAIAKEAKLMVVTREFSAIYENFKNILTIEPTGAAS